MRAEDDVGARFDEEGVLHVACGVIIGKVHRTKYVPVVFHFWTFRHSETEACEDVNDFTLRERKGVACAELHGICRAREVEVRKVIL